MHKKNVRLEAVCKLLRRHQARALVLTNPADQFFVLGFPFYEGEAVFLLHSKGVVGIMRSLYVGPFRKFAPWVETMACDEDRLGCALNYIKQHRLTGVGFDAAKTSYLDGKRMRQIGCIELPSLISSLRQTKDAHELKQMRRSNQIAYLAYEYVKPRLKTGMMECEAASMLEQFMRSRGGSATSFETIVAFGENAANPHHKTGTRKLKKEDAVLMDFGCVYEGYCSDITRCWWHGKREPEEYKKIWKIVDTARRSGIKAARVGTATKDVDATSRGVISRAGYADYFTHRTGPGVGIEIHEEPCNSADSKAVLCEGNVVTVEPGIYLPGKFGVRLEDTIVITKSGAKILTKK